MDITQLKMKELVEVEHLAGLTMDEWEQPTAKLMMAIAYVLGKKTNPKLTWEQVEDMTVEELSSFAGGTELPKANNS